MATTFVAGGLIVPNLRGGYALVALLAGSWVMMLTFGTGIKRFLNEDSGA